MREFQFTVNGQRVFVSAANIAEARRRAVEFFARSGQRISEADLIEGPAQFAGQPPGTRPGDVILSPTTGGGTTPQQTGTGGDPNDIGLQALAAQGVADATLPQAELIDREAAFPQAAFRQFLRSNRVRPGGIGASVLEGQFAPATTAFSNLNELGLVPEGTSFTDFLGQGPIGSQRFSSDARRALANSQLPEDFQVFGQGGTFTSQAENLANLVRQAGRAGARPFSSGIFTPSTADVQRRAQDRGFQGQETDFLNFLRQQFAVPQGA